MPPLKRWRQAERLNWGRRASIGQDQAILPVRDQAIPNYSHWGMQAIAGDRPPRYGMQGRLPFTVGRGPVPRRASICTRNGVGWRSFFARIERSRGTGPRATGLEGVLLAVHPFGIRRSRTTVSRPYNPANRDNLVNPAHLWGTREIAGDRPPRYGNIETPRFLLPNTSKYETPSVMCLSNPNLFNLTCLQ